MYTTAPRDFLTEKGGAPSSQAIPLSTFILDTYTGKYGSNATVLANYINSHFGPLLAAPTMESDHLQLQFLYICVNEVYLQNSCARKDCAKLFLRKKHSVIDHLRELFFAWTTQKYGLSVANCIDQYGRMSKILGSLCETLETKPEENIALASMAATLLPFITKMNGNQGYDICYLNADFYHYLHNFPQHPYVRLGGKLKRQVFVLDCHNFDMRGVDFLGTRFYGDEHIDAKRNGFLTIEQRDTQLQLTHANFSNADLRFADLRNTVVDPGLSSSLNNTFLEGALLAGRNINASSSIQHGTHAAVKPIYCTIL